MNQDEEKAIAIRMANTMFSDLLKNQPNMFQSVTATESGGKELAEFISALRGGLIDMYRKERS